MVMVMREAEGQDVGTRCGTILKCSRPASSACFAYVCEVEEACVGMRMKGRRRGGGHGRRHRGDLLSFTDGGRLKQAMNSWTHAS